MINKQILSFFYFFKIFLELVGSYSNEYKKSIYFYTLAYSFQAFAYVCFYPLLNTFFIKKFILEDSIFYFTLMIVLSIISFILKWYAQNFDYDGVIIKISHDLRLKLGEKLKKIPLETLQEFKI